MDKHKMFFQIFNALWNAAIQKDKSPSGYWNALPEWSKLYLAYLFEDVEPLRQGEDGFTPACPSIKQMTFQCLADDDDSMAIVTWNSEDAPPLREIRVDLDFDRYLPYFMPLKDRAGNLLPPLELQKREVAD
jgi:hypothetical protein